MASRDSSVTVIGLGAMGLPIAKNLAKSGVTTYAWNRSSAPAQDAASHGVTIIDDISKVDSKYIFTVLPDLPQVAELLEKGLEAKLQSGDYLVVMGTVSPVAVKELAIRLSNMGIKVIDAPLSGGDVGAQNATLSIMIGGDESSFNELLPYFEKIGKTIRLLGPVGSGQLAKACNQIVVAITLTALAEAVTLGRKAGLDTKTLLDILAGGLAGSQALNVKREKIENENYSPGGSAVFQLKDLRFALEAGKESGVQLPVTTEVTSLFESLVEHGNGALDHSGIIREIERLANSVE